MPGKVFISYRRRDTKAEARNIYDRLVAEFGPTSVFMDVDSLTLGRKFDEQLEFALGQCQVLIAVIGVHWLETLRAQEHASERDFVRHEISLALARGLPIIPIMIDGTPLPPALTLPEDIRQLVYYQKYDLSHEHFGRDIGELISNLQSLYGLSSARSRTRWLQRALWAASYLSIVLMIAFAILIYAGVPLPNLFQQIQNSQTSSKDASDAEGKAADRRREEDAKRQAELLSATKEEYEKSKQATEDLRRATVESIRQQALTQQKIQSEAALQESLLIATKHEKEAKDALDRAAREVDALKKTPNLAMTTNKSVDASPSANKDCFAFNGEQFCN